VPMEPRAFSLIDRLIGEIDKAIKVLSAPARSDRGAPEAPAGELMLKEAERQESGRLMRVNHPERSPRRRCTKDRR